MPTSDSNRGIKLERKLDGKRHIWRARAQREFEGGSIGRNVAQIVVALYNKGLRSRQVAPL